MFDIRKLSASFVCIAALAGGAFCWAAPSNLVTVGNKQLGVTLDGSRNYCLSTVWVKGVEFPSGGAFPCFKLYDPAGKEASVPAGDSVWHANYSRFGNGVTVAYSRDGFSADVDYKISKGMITITVTPKVETAWKIRALTDDNKIVSVPSNVPGAEDTGFLIKPYLTGELIRFPKDKQICDFWEPQHWKYQASFFGVGYNGHGLIVRCPQFGAVWIAGTGDVNNVYSIYGGLTADFRPRHDNPATVGYPFWKMPLVEPKIDVQLVPVDETNGDGVFNWVDVAVTYRNKFIKRNKYLDKAEVASVSGKIDIGDQWEGNRNYTQLLEQIKTIDFAPQRWWLVGAYTAPGYHYDAPCNKSQPDPSHNGPGGYDYFAFKSDAAKIGAKIGLHEKFQETAIVDGIASGNWPVKYCEDGKPTPIFSGEHNGKSWVNHEIAFNAVLRDGSFFRALDQHFKDWDLHPGDTWHWDVFTAIGGLSDFSYDHPSTHGSDIRDRIKILKYIDEKGIHMTSEGLQEGLAEYCTFSWVAQADPTWKSRFSAGEAVPLIPVLFQGKTYYAAEHGAWALLYGGKGQWESVAPADRDWWIEEYFNSVVFWGLIADRTVKNMIKTENGWNVEYTEGGSLSVDLATKDYSKSFVLEIDGKKYTPDNPPASPWGVKAKRVNGKYVLYR